MFLLVISRHGISLIFMWSLKVFERIVGCHGYQLGMEFTENGKDLIELNSISGIISR